MPPFYRQNGRQLFAKAPRVELRSGVTGLSLLLRIAEPIFVRADGTVQDQVILDLNAYPTVFRLNNSRSSNHNPKQDNKLQQPLWVPNQLKGFPVARFDGLQDSLLMATTTELGYLKNINGFAFIGLIRHQGSANPQTLYWHSQGVDGTLARFQVTIHTDNKLRARVGRLDGDTPWLVESSGTVAPNTWAFVAVQVDLSGTPTVAMEINNVTQTVTTVSGTTTTGATSNTNAVSAGFGAAVAGTTLFFNGDMALLLAPQNAMTLTNRQNFVSDFNAFYGVF